jgi:hypothetical protein
MVGRPAGSGLKRRSRQWENSSAPAICSTKGLTAATSPTVSIQQPGRTESVITDSEGRTHRDLNKALAMDLWLLNRWREKHAAGTQFVIDSTLKNVLHMNSQLTTIEFMPWCRLDKKYVAGPVALIPFSRDNPPDNLEAGVIEVIQTVLSHFLDLDGRPIPHCTLVSLDGRLLLDGFVTLAEFQAVYDHVQLACLSALEGREYPGPAEPYCNSECFALFMRQYRDRSAVAPPIFRRDGTPMGLGVRPYEFICRSKLFLYRASA